MPSRLLGLGLGLQFHPALSSRMCSVPPSIFFRHCARTRSRSRANAAPLNSLLQIKSCMSCGPAGSGRQLARWRSFQYVTLGNVLDLRSAPGVLCCVLRLFGALTHSEHRCRADPLPYSLAVPAQQGEGEGEGRVLAGALVDPFP